MKVSHILMIGCGNMGTALLSRWVAAYPDMQCDIITASAARHDALHAIAPTITCHTARDTLRHERYDMVIFAVKPQQAAKVLPEYADIAAQKGTTSISIMAGIACEQLSALLSGTQTICRAMPNMAARIGQSATPIFHYNANDADAAKHAETLFACVGSVYPLAEESHMHAATAIAGSSPAYVMHFAEAFETAAAQQGIDTDMAREMAREALLASAALLAEDGANPTEIRTRITSPGGTTEAALQRLMDQETGFEPLMKNAMAACIARSKALSNL